MADCVTSRVPSIETEESLISRVRLRDQGALADIYDRFSSIVYSIALRVLREPSAAEAVMQEVFIEVWRNPNAYSLQRGPLSAYLALIGRKRAIDTLRQRKPEDRIEDIAPASNPNLGDLAERECTLSEVRRAIKSLPTIQRQVFELAFFGGLTLIEIATSTGEPIDIVKTCICNAMLSIRNATKLSACRHDVADCKPSLEAEAILS